jgi:hypothetical protein
MDTTRVVAGNHRETMIDRARQRVYSPYCRDALCSNDGLACCDLVYFKTKAGP